MYQSHCMNYFQTRPTTLSPRTRCICGVSDRGALGFVLWGVCQSIILRGSVTRSIRLIQLTHLRVKSLKTTWVSPPLYQPQMCQASSFHAFRMPCYGCPVAETPASQESCSPRQPSLLLDAYRKLHTSRSVFLVLAVKLFLLWCKNFWSLSRHTYYSFSDIFSNQRVVLSYSLMVLNIVLFHNLSCWTFEGDFFTWDFSVF